MFFSIFLVLMQFFVFLTADELHKKIETPDDFVINTLETSAAFWNEKAQNYLKATLERKLNTNKAKNIIFFIGDGMSIPTVAAARMYVGGKEETELSFEKFPHYGLTKTYCVDKQMADSACTTTAYLGGIKGNGETIGLNAKVLSQQCYVEESDHVDSIAKWAQDSCKSVGVVTTTKITNATPAGLYSSTSFRNFETNAAIERVCGDKHNLTDIAIQLVHGEIGKKLKVILGGGRQNLMNQTEIDEEGEAGRRTDGRNLINEWIEERSGKGKAKYVWHKQQLDEIDFDSTDYLMGLFENDHCLYNTDIINHNLQAQEPSLTEMTVAAIKMLQKEKNGYFLFVEGGKIDVAQHQNQVQKTLEETKEFARAIEVARLMTNEADTLIVVSSDHSHGLTYSGYAVRGSDILGASEISDLDGLPYETLSYPSGPGFATTYTSGSRVDLRTVDLKNPEHKSAATVPLDYGDHAGDDVGVYASGPWSHLFVGNYEQNVIPLLMAKAAGIGPYAEVDDRCSGASQILSLNLFLLFMVSWFQWSLFN